LPWNRILGFIGDSSEWFYIYIYVTVGGFFMALRRGRGVEGEGEGGKERKGKERKGKKLYV
jgi:hypothetical protein